MGDPRGWEALTQQEAEQDARAAGWLDGVERRAEVFGGGYYLVPASDWLGVLDCFRMGERLLAVAVRERDQAAAANERLVETNRALSRSAIGNRDGRKKAERERDQARDALRRIAENAESWHGPPPDDSGHVRALAVIASSARAALAGGETVNQKPKGHTA